MLKSIDRLFVNSLIVAMYTLSFVREPSVTMFIQKIIFFQIFLGNNMAGCGSVMKLDLLVPVPLTH